jgi:hypothetical protein
MSEDYEIDCKLCGQIHVPIWGKRSALYSANKHPDTITVPYTCPVNGAKADATFPYSPEIYQKSIIGWKGS